MENLVSNKRKKYILLVLVFIVLLLIVNKEVHSIEYNDAHFDGDSYEYNNNLAKLSLELVESSASINNIKKALCRYNFNSDNNTKFFGFEDDDNEYVDMCISLNEDYIKDDDLLVVVLSCYYGDKGWASNFKVGSNELYHQGFYESAKTNYLLIKDYINTKSLNTDKVKVLITGFSRSAAVANITSILLSSEGLLKRDNIYTYAFATPNYIENTGHNSDYDNIFNIINPNDLVTLVPLSSEKTWNFTRLGKDVLLNVSVNKQREIKEKISNFYSVTFNTYPEQKDNFLYILNFLGEAFSTRDIYEENLQQLLITFLLNEEEALNMVNELLCPEGECDGINCITIDDVIEVLTSSKTDYLEVISMLNTISINRKKLFGDNDPFAILIDKMISIAVEFSLGTNQKLKEVFDMISMMIKNSGIDVAINHSPLLYLTYLNKMNPKKITLSSNIDKSPSCDLEYASAGCSVYIRSFSSDDYYLSDFEIKTANGLVCDYQIVDTETYVFTMPNEEVTINSFFEKYEEYSVTIINEGKGTCYPNKYKAKEGEEITLSIDNLSSDNYLKKLKVISGNVQILNNKFIINDNVVIKAIFSEAEKYYINASDYKSVIIRDSVNGKLCLIKDGVEEEIGGNTIFEFTGDNEEFSIEVFASKVAINFAGLNIKSHITAPVKVNDNSYVTLDLNNDNTISSTSTGCAGIDVEKDATLYITGIGMLEARGGDNASAIGGGNKESIGNIIIKCKKLTALGGTNGAGIGGIGAIITIEEGQVIVKGGLNARGIDYDTNIFFGAKKGRLIVTGGMILIDEGRNPVYAVDKDNKTLVSTTLYLKEDKDLSKAKYYDINNNEVLVEYNKNHMRTYDLVSAKIACLFVEEGIIINRIEIDNEVFELKDGYFTAIKQENNFMQYILYSSITIGITLLLAILIKNKKRKN